MSNPPKHLYEFGQFRLDMERPRLTRDGEVIPLTPKALDVLSVLVQSGGNLVEKEDLMQKVWPDTFVEDGNLSVHIFALRKALGENAEGQGYIETLPKLGYRFVGSVQEVDPNGAELVVERHALSRVIVQEESDSHARATTPGPLALPARSETSREVFWTKRPSVVIMILLALALTGVLAYLWMSNKATAPATSAEVKSMAVLPFQSLSAEAEDEYLALGLTDMLITQFGHTRKVVVRPTSAVLKYTKTDQDAIAIGRRLGVQAVLEGSVQRAGERLRVTVRLFRVSDGAPLWAGKFDEKFSDIFTVEDSISQQVAVALRLHFEGTEQPWLRKRHTESTEAYQAYLKGRYFWNKRSADGLRRAIEYFNQAVEIDPTFPLPYVGLAESYDLLIYYSDLPPNDLFPKSRAAAMRALEIDSQLGEAHVPMARVKAYYEWDQVGAHKEFQRAVELSPNYDTARQWYGEYLTNVGKFEEGIVELKRALEIDPLSLAINVDLGTAFYSARQYDQAISQYRKTLEIDPDFPLCHSFLGMAYSAKGLNQESILEHQRAIALAGERPILLALLGHALATAGRKDEARTILAQLKERSNHGYIAPFNLVLLHVGLGDWEQAFGWLEKAYQEHDPWLLQFIRNYQHLDGLRSDPRFQDLLRRVGIT